MKLLAQVPALACPLLAFALLAPRHALAEETTATVTAAPGTPGAPAVAPNPGDADVGRLRAIFDTEDDDLIDEALAQLRWAGITDKRLYNHLLDVLRRNAFRARRSGEVREQYIEALGYSGNPDVYAALQAYATDPTTPSGDRSDAMAALQGSTRYIEIAREMQQGTASATTAAELWAARHRNGLHTGDGVRMRLAARDMFVNPYGRESMAVAEAVLRERAASPMTDDNVEDALAFLCKVLGRSGRAEYLPVLTYVANNARTDKLKEHGERWAQRLDSSFVASNPYVK